MAGFWARLAHKWDREMAVEFEQICATNAIRNSEECVARNKEGFDQAVREGDLRLAQDLQWILAGSLARLDWKRHCARQGLDVGERPPRWLVDAYREGMTISDDYDALNSKYY